MYRIRTKVVSVIHCEYFIGQVVESLRKTVSAGGRSENTKLPFPTVDGKIIIFVCYAYFLKKKKKQLS